MLVLGIDTCCMPATSAVYDGEKLVGEAIVNCGKTHSQKIMPQIEALLNSLELKPADIDCFAAAAGPGSFTGVRIGTATIKAMAHAAGKPCAAVSTLKALANNVPYFDGIICPILDARRNQVYTAEFLGDGTLRRVCEDKAVSLDSLLDELKNMKKKVLFLGDGILVYREEILECLGENAKFAKGNNNLNMAGSVAELGYEALLSGDTISYAELAPNYIRLSQAERERLERKTEAKEN